MYFSLYLIIVAFSVLFLLGSMLEEVSAPLLPLGPLKRDRGLHGICGAHDALEEIRPLLKETHRLLPAQWRVVRPYSVLTGIRESIAHLLQLARLLLKVSDVKVAGDAQGVGLADVLEGLLLWRCISK